MCSEFEILESLAAISILKNQLTYSNLIFIIKIRDFSDGFLIEVSPIYVRNLMYELPR